MENIRQQFNFDTIDDMVDCFSRFNYTVDEIVSRHIDLVRETVLKKTNTTSIHDLSIINSVNNRNKNFSIFGIHSINFGESADQILKFYKDREAKNERV